MLKPTDKLRVYSKNELLGFLDSNNKRFSREKDHIELMFDTINFFKKKQDLKRNKRFVKKIKRKAQKVSDILTQKPQIEQQSDSERNEDRQIHIQTFYKGTTKLKFYKDLYKDSAIFSFD